MQKDSLLVRANKLILNIYNIAKSLLFLHCMLIHAGIIIIILKVLVSVCLCVTEVDVGVH